MKSVVFHAYGDVDVLGIEDIVKPVPEADEVLVRVRAAAVNPKDTFIRKGRFRNFTGDRFPMQTGFEFAGEIVDQGPRVHPARTGEKVYGLLDGWQGRACAQFITVKAHQVAPKPKTLTIEASAALPLVALTALQALRDEAGMQSGHTVCINGASGGVGSMAVQIAKINGAAVTAISRTDHHPLLKRLGADVCLDYQEVDITRSGRQFDIFFDVFGNSSFEAVQPILAREGIWVSTVLKPEVFAAVEKTKTAAGRKASLVIVHADSIDLETVARWVDSGQLSPVIQKIFSMEQIAEAHKQQETKHTQGKIVISIP